MGTSDRLTSALAEKNETSRIPSITAAFFVSTMLLAQGVKCEGFGDTVPKGQVTNVPRGAWPQTGAERQQAFDDQGFP